MLSQIERGLANPSIQTLKTLAKSLDVPTFSFFIEETNTMNLVVRSNSRKKMIIENLSYELVSPDFYWKPCSSHYEFPTEHSFIRETVGA
ncbi:hypothetical protein GCM10020331_095210 [Ectobacillus funiculus]